MKRTGSTSIPNGFLAMIVLLIFVSGIAAMLVSGHNLNSANKNSSSPIPSKPASNVSTDTLEGINSQAISPNAAEEDSNLPSGYKLITVLNEDIHRGTLILVNYQNESWIDGENLVNLYDNVSKSVGVKDDDMFINSVVLDPLNKLFDDFKKAKGDTTILISSSYRSKSDQTKIYSDSVEQTGKKSTAYYVAVPGFSEHQTGYCFDTAAINYEGDMVELDGEGDFSWLSDNCADYGFILRYPHDKTNITGIGYESWHFRYTGIPHALFIKEHSLCLEEYISGLKNYTFEKGGLLIDGGSKGKWVTFYVPKLDAFNNTDIPVPADSAKTPYTVSGNNIDGFIITVDVTKDSANSLLEKASSNWLCDTASLVIEDFHDYDPELDTEEDDDTERKNKGWESDSFWGDETDSENSDTDSVSDDFENRFEYVDYYDDYSEDYQDYEDNGENQDDGEISPEEE